MKFAHFADCHLGGWRDEKLNELNLRAFSAGVSRCISEKVDFLLISGDLFNTSLPGIDKLKEAVRNLKLLKNEGIPVYIIAGSHDFSPSGKTMIDVLEEAGLVVNVVRGSVTEGKLKLDFTVDKRTGAKIAGMLGRRGMLEKSFYENLEKTNLEAETGFKIFMFHTAITELKAKEFENIDSAPVSLLPAGFDYYAGGHVHIVREFALQGYKRIVYPGPLFPNSFSELEKLGQGGFYIFNDGALSRASLNLVGVYSIAKDCSGMSPEQVEAEIKKEIAGKAFDDAIVTLKLFGVLKSGKPSDININALVSLIYEKSAFFVMKNLNQLESTEFEEIKVKESSIEETESCLISEHLGRSRDLGIDAEKEMQLTKELLALLSREKTEGEKVYEFDDKIARDARKLTENHGV
jgi:DNA repair exonuclease SbcCD nuclease subunit